MHWRPYLIILLTVYGAVNKIYAEAKSESTATSCCSDCNSCDDSTQNAASPEPPSDCNGYLNETNAVVKAFIDYAIVPQIIPRPPTRPITIILANINIDLGTFIPPFTLGILPTAVTWAADPKSLYTLLFINAEANFILYGTYELLFLPLLIVNIPGDDISSGDALLAYRPFLPIPGYGPHRYLGFVYKQPKRINITLDLTISISTSSKFNLSNFVKTFDLGDPIFGNFLTTSLSFCDTKPSSNVC